MSDHPQFKPYDQDLKSISILLENELAQSKLIGKKRLRSNNNDMVTILPGYVI
jgi:hypothetical protein